MVKRRPILACPNWLLAFCAAAALSLPGIAGGAEPASRDSPAVHSRELHPASTLSPSGGPGSWGFSLTAEPFAGFGAVDISAKGVFGEWIVYADFGNDQFLFFKRTQIGLQFVQAIAAENFVAIGAAPLDFGILFLGLNRATRQAILKEAYIGTSTPTPTITTRPLAVDLSGGGFIKGDSLGNWGGGSKKDGKVFLHWNSMPPDQVAYYNTNLDPVDAVFEPKTGFNVIFRNAQGIAQYPPDGSAPKYSKLGSSPSSVTMSPNGNLIVGEYGKGLVDELDPSTLLQKAQYPVRSEFGFSYVPAGNPGDPPILESAGGSTISFSKVELDHRVTETDVTLSRGTLIDYENIPGSQPFAVLLDVLDPNTGRGGVFLLEAVGRDPDPDAVSHRLELEPTLQSTGRQ